MRISQSTLKIVIVIQVWLVNTRLSFLIQFLSTFCSQDLFWITMAAARMSTARTLCLLVLVKGERMLAKLWTIIERRRTTQQFFIGYCRTFAEILSFSVCRWAFAPPRFSFKLKFWRRRKLQRKNVLSTVRIQWMYSSRTFIRIRATSLGLSDG